MRHGKSGRKFNMDSTQRTAMLRGLAVALFRYEQIRTTITKAKEVRKLAERTITLGTRCGELLTKEHGDLSGEEKARLVHAKRMARSALGVNPAWKSAEEKAELKEDALNAEGPKRAEARDSVDVIDWLFTVIAPRYLGRPGGYTRIIREAKVRAGDAAPMAVIALVADEPPAPPPKAEAKGKGGKAKSAPEAKGDTKKKGGKAAKAEAPAEKPKKAKKKKGDDD
jgi:large subunit ribosomal protein L17